MQKLLRAAVCMAQNEFNQIYYKFNQKSGFMLVLPEDGLKQFFATWSS